MNFYIENTCSSDMLNYSWSVVLARITRMAGLAMSGAVLTGIVMLIELVAVFSSR